MRWCKAHGFNFRVYVGFNILMEHSGLCLGWYIHAADTTSHGRVYFFPARLWRLCDYDNV